MGGKTIVNEELLWYQRIWWWDVSN